LGLQALWRLPSTMCVNGLLTFVGRRYNSYNPSQVFELTFRFLIKGNPVFVQETTYYRLSDIGFGNIDYCKEDNRLILTIREVFVFSTFIFELVLVVWLST